MINEADVKCDGNEHYGVNVVLVVKPTIVPNSKQQFEGEQSQESSISCSARGKPDPKYMFFKVCCLKFLVYVIIS